MDFDPSGDFELFDGVTEVAYRSRRDGDKFDTPVTVLALRRATESSEIPAGPAVVHRRAVVFHVRASDMTSEPKPGDTITESTGQSWAVYMTGLQTLLARYRLSCVEIP